MVSFGDELSVGNETDTSGTQLLGFTDDCDAILICSHTKSILV